MQLTFPVVNHLQTVLRQLCRNTQFLQLGSSREFHHKLLLLPGILTRLSAVHHHTLTSQSLLMACSTDDLFYHVTHIVFIVLIVLLNGHIHDILFCIVVGNTTGILPDSHKVVAHIEKELVHGNLKTALLFARFTSVNSTAVLFYLLLIALLIH